MSKYSEDESKLALIKTGDQLFLKKLYGEYRIAFIAFLMKYFKCSREDALTAYAEAFAEFYQNVVDEKLLPPLRSELKTYLFSIGKNIFHKRFLGTYQQKMTFPEVMKEGFETAEVLDRYELDAQVKIVRALLAQLKESCQQLIRLMFFENQEAAEVAEVMGFNSAGAVRKHKYDCLNKMREIYKNRNRND